MERTQKVVITGANCVTARLLIPLLRSKGYYTTGLVRAAASTDADETISDWMNAGRAKQALTDADLVIHLPGEINARKKSVYIQANLTTTEIVVDTVRKGRASRIIFLSYPGADLKSKNLYLRYKGAAEQLLLSLDKEIVIFRCPVIIDSPDKPSRIDTMFISRNGKGVPVIGDGEQRMHPVCRTDVVSMLAAALERGRPGVYELSGCEEMTVNQFIRLVNHNPGVNIAHTPGWMARMLARLVKGLSPTFVDILLNHTDSRYDPLTYKEFGVQPGSLTQLWSK